MITTKQVWKSKKNSKVEVSKRDNISEVDIKNNPETNVSLLTKRTGPSVIIQSENMDTHFDYKNIRKRRILKSICMIVLGIIIMMTFFLSLRTYNIVTNMNCY